jgi:hypothetical protein
MINLRNILALLILLVGPVDAMGQSEALIKQMTDLSNQIQNCGQNLACIQQLSNEIMELQKQFQQQGGGLSAKSGYESMEKPCERFPQGLNGQFCIPVNVTVTSHNIEQQVGRIYSGLLPDPGKPYTRLYLAYDYKAEGRGMMIYNADFSEFQLYSFGSREKTRITQLKGEWNNWDNLNQIMDHKILNAGSVKVRNPFNMSVIYPLSEEYDPPIRTNISLIPNEIETSDDYLPIYYAGEIHPSNPDLNSSFIITPKDMAAFVKHGGFEHTFSWRFEQPGGNDWSDHRVTVKVSFGDGCQDPVKLRIVSPDIKEFKYSYNDAKVGVLTMALVADVTPAKYLNNVVWQLPEMAGTIREVTPKNLKGPTVKVKYTLLPKKNSEFGPKVVTARVKTKTCSVKAKQVVKFYYFRDDQNNPDGNVPNWFYYWKQTPAGRPQGHQADIRYGKTDFLECSKPGVTGVYNSVVLPNSITICDLTKFGPRMKLTYPKVERTVPATLKTKHKATTEGIDTFAVAVLHEFQHLKDYHAMKKDLDKPDGDGDGIPDFLEKSMGFDKTQFQTFFGNDPEFKKIGGDEEFMAYEAMFGYTPGIYDAYDWGLPGRNWPVK